MDECSSCSGTTGSKVWLALQIVKEDFSKSCIFSEYGCSIKLPKEEQENHSHHCKYKPVHCPSLGCDELVPINAVMKHMDDNKPKHMHFKFEASMVDLVYLQINEIMKNQRSRMLSPARITLDDHYFYGIFWREPRPLGRWHIWLYMVGTPEESRKYMFTARITNQDPFEELSYTGQTVSVEMGRQQIISEGRCLIFNDETFKRFCLYDSIVVHIDVRRNPTH